MQALVYLGGVLLAVLMLSLFWAMRGRRRTTTPVSERWLADQRRLKDDL